MALKKAIRQDDGVTTNYHRISYLNISTNRCNNIAVLSYVDEEARTNEQGENSSQPYHKAVTHIAPYDPEMTIETAYNYLKSLPQFEGAEDV